MRKSILACTVSFLMSPMATWALGMGDIQVNSSLNRPLKAEIAISSVSKKDLESLQIGLAPRKIYSRASIERSDYLSRLRFKLIQRGGKNYVSITTKKPFREPFANFLIEAVWSSGRLVREYTMLIDPPELVRKHARPVTTAIASSSSKVKRKKPGKKLQTSTGKGKNYVLTPSGELSYGPTKRNDTLWVIAKNMAPENVSVNQMMMALLRDNPKAFVANNINNLKSGYVLRIKDPDSLGKLNRTNARRQVREQYQSWKKTRKQQSTTSLVDRSDRSSASTPVDGKLKLLASGSSDNAGTQGDLSSKINQFKEKLSLAGEELESKEVENQELKARVKELEELLETKSSLVELKDASLAAMQKQKEMQAIDEQAESAIESEPEVEAESEPEAESIVDIDMPAESVTMGQPIISEKELAEQIDPSVELSNDEIISADSNEILSTDDIEILPDAVQPEVTPDEQPAEIQAIEHELVPEAEPEPVVKPEEESKSEPKKVPQQNVMDMLLGEEMLPYTAGAGGLLVLILGWLGLRGRSKNDNDFEESILDSKMGGESDFSVDNSELADSTLANTSEVLASNTETSFLSDFSADDMESLQPDDTEADPISEADVFMVYGRYQQAEELLQNALKAEPERLDYQLKLLEVYHGDNLQDSFAVQADVVKDLLKKNDDNYELTPEWIKVKSWAEKLGVDIDMPDSFDEDLSTAAVAATAAAAAVGSAALATDLLADDSQDGLSLESEEINLNEDSILGDSDEDFDLSLDDSLVEVEDSLSLTDVEDSLSLSEVEDSLTDLDELADNEETTEFSLDDLDLDDGAVEASEDDLELSLDDIGANDDANEFDLDEATLNLDNSIELEEDSLEPEDSLELEDSLEIADDSSVEEDTSESDTDDNLDLDLDNDTDFLDDDFDEDFPELDAVGTKLDLAKAYIDMGDMESATSILNEVIDEGDEDQKSQAQSLLEQSSS